MSVSLTASVLLVSPTSTGYEASDNLAERCLKAKVKWGRQRSSLRFTPAQFTCELDVTDGAYPETQTTLEQLLQSEVYLAVQAHEHPVVLFHGWTTEVKWTHTDGRLRTLQLSALDALGHLRDLVANPEFAPDESAVEADWWTTHDWLSRPLNSYTELRQVKALRDGLWFASPNSSEGPPLAAVTGHNVLKREALPYTRLLNELRHQTQGRVGVAHGWLARYSSPNADHNRVLKVWGEVSRNSTSVTAEDAPLPSYLGAEYTGLLNDSTTAFVQHRNTGVPNTHPGPFFSEKLRFATPTQKEQYRGYQWTLSNTPEFEGAAEPEDLAFPVVTTDYLQRVNTHHLVPGVNTLYIRPPPTNYFTSSVAQLFESACVEFNYLNSVENYVSWSNNTPRLSYKGVRVPVHFSPTPEVASAILCSNLFTKVRVRVTGRSSELLDRAFLVDGVTWTLRPFYSGECGVDAKFDLLEMRQTCPWVLGATTDPSYNNQFWNQGELSNGNVLTA